MMADDGFTKSRVGQQIRVAFSATAALLVAAVALYAIYSLGFEKDIEWRCTTHTASFVATTSRLDFDSYQRGLAFLGYALDTRRQAKGQPGGVAITRVLDRFRRVYPALSAVVVLTPRGRVVGAVGPWALIAAPWAHHRLVAGADQTPGFHIARPQRYAAARAIPLWYGIGRQRPARFVILAVLPLAAQQGLWKHLSLPRGIALGLLRADGVLESRWPGEPKGIYRHRVHGVLARAMARHPGRVTQRYEGRVAINGAERLGAYVRLRRSPLVAFASVPISDVYWGWWGLIQGPVVMLALVLAGIYVLYRWALRRQVLWEAESRRAETLLFEAKERVEVMLRSIMDAVIATDTEGRIQYVNPTAERVTGWTQAETQGRLLNEIFPCLDEYNGNLLDPLAGCLEGRALGPQDALLFHRDGRPLPVERTAAPIRGPGGDVTGMVLVFRDITEKRVLTERLAHQATHDPLTQLPNRLLYGRRLERAISEAREHHARVALLFLDLDGFKGINDSLGHGTGDQVLRGVAQRLRRAMRASDTLARLGGDEFAIVLPGLARRHEVVPVIQKIMAIFEEPILDSPMEIFLGGSIGIAIFPDDGEDAQALSRSADAAMYEAKAAGKNTYRFFSNSMREQAAGRLSLEAHLHRALERGEFRVLYQPRVRPADGRLVGVEALLCWMHPSGRLRMPSEFMAAADEAGLSVALGNGALETACRQTRSWRDLGLPSVPVAVAMTARQCVHEATPALIDQVLRTNTLSPEDLMVELAEESLAKESEPLAGVLRSRLQQPITDRI